MSKEPRQPKIKSIEVEFVDAKKEDEQDFTFERVEDAPEQTRKYEQRTHCNFQYNFDFEQTRKHEERTYPPL